MGNMASAILLGAVRSGFLKGEETVAYDLNGFKLDSMNKACGMARAASTEEVTSRHIILEISLETRLILRVAVKARIKELQIFF